MAKRTSLSLCAVCVFSWVFFPATCPASGPLARPDVVRDAEVVSVNGEGWVRFRGGEGWLDAFREQILTAGDLLRTGDYGRMGVLFAGGIQIRMSRKTTLAIRETPKAGGKKSMVLGLDIGEVWSRSEALPEGLRIETPAATAAIRGTDWDLSVDETGRSHLTVLAGAVSFFNDYGSLVVEAGEQAVAEPGKAPVKSFLVRPRERVQWVFSYPMNVADLLFFHSHRRQEVIEALPGARKATEGNPADLGARLFLAGLLFDLREKQESLRLFDEVLAREPKNAKALAFRGLLALDRGDVGTAKTCFDSVLETRGGDATVPALVGRMGVALQEGRVAEAANLLKGIEDADARQPQVGVVAAVFHAFLGDFTKAVDTALRYETLFPRDERFPILLASFYTVLDEGDKAYEAVRKGLDQYPSSSQGYSVLAGLEHLEGKGPDAEAAYRRAIELDPTNAAARNGLALLKMERGEYEEAREHLSETVARAPENPMAWANRGVLLTLLEKLEDARQDYRQALERDPTHYMTLTGLGLVALKESKTQDAVEHFLKASLLEPDFSQPHSFLAVAYYQLGQVERALGELAVASRLDSKDPFPHLIAYLIYQDTYRPFEAIEEARRVLDLLPYLKSVEEIENTKVGLSNLGSALLGFGLSEWSESYSQESFDPHNASSHFQASRRYNDNHYVAVSELVQGLLLDPLANSRPARYLDLIRRPRWDASLSGTWGDEDGGFSQQYSGVVQGYSRKPWETSCSLGVQGYDKQGSVDNGDSDGVNLALGLGIKPDYRNSVNFGFTASRDESGQPGLGPILDPDDRLESEGLSADLGYRHRFGPKNNVLARAGYDRWIFKSRNPAPFGTGLTDIQASFLYAGFPVEETRRFFQQGVYDATALFEDEEGITLATDSTGTLAEIPEVFLLPRRFPSFVDTDAFRYEKSDQETFLLQARHLVNLGESHEFTWGAEYIPLKVRRKQEANVFVTQDTIYFYEEPFLNPDDYGWEFNLVSPIEVTERSTDEGRFITAYVDDRWKAADWLLIEGGLFFESFYDDENEDSRAYPRVGAAVRILKHHILRLGYLHWLEKVSSGSLAPVAVAGLVVDNSLGLQGSRLYDYQVRFESRWTSRLFTVFGGERVELKDAALAGGLPKREIHSNRAMAAVNAIVAKQLGVFLRYLYSHAEGSGGFFDGLSVPGVPDHVGSGGVVWIAPFYLKVLVTETYVGEQYVDYSNDEKLSSFWITSLSASWEPFQKHGFIGFSASNLFNEGDPAPGRSAYITLEYRF